MTEPVLPSEAFMTMSALGYLDISYSESGSEVNRWAISPPTLVEISGDVAFLSGGRSRRLMAALREGVNELGGSLEPQMKAGGPTVWFISGLYGAELDLLASVVSDESGVALGVGRDVGGRIGHALPDLEEISVTQDLVGPAGQLDRFSITGRDGGVRVGWRPVSGTDQPGLYKTARSRPVGYWLLKGGLWRRTSYRVGKHLTAKWADRPLLSYDGTHLYCSLGAQLPGLYERAVVQASGMPPERDGWRMKYADTPSSVARAVFESVYSRGI
jgi:hypothetical protein